MPEPGTIALDLTCAECGPLTSSLRDVADLVRRQGRREAVTYYPECAEREFGEPE
jgi:hypothetical protein